MPKWSSQMYDHTMVVELEAATKKIKDWLFEAAREGKQEILAIGVVGMGGLGDASVGDNANELLKKINQYLLGKRYLIMMDDV
ncbi:hypothetical protein J1N35_025120 [Gossypium stocksii]|uniref:Uncharacterized protein n=1 Tax=Gossypium stocksii TaxID=47602 RepID=A0A9D3V5P4_9ROSI|nr:hypothetical protein J1N35_025120 [Gossypium stocksii]